MKFIILLICLVLQASLHINVKRNKYQFVDRYAAGIKPLLNKINADHGWGALVGLLLPILIFVIILNALFSHIGLLYLIYGTIILWLCLDFTDLKKQLVDYFTAVANENMVKAKTEAELFVLHTVHQDKSEMSRAVTEAIFIRSLTNIFSIIFWFMLLGPFGAVLYYMTTAITNCALKPEFGYSDTYNVANYFKEILDWLPVRLVALTFALIGHFGPVFALWIDRVGGGLAENRQLIIDAGLTAINADLAPSTADVIENHQALSLVTRTLWTWVIIIAVLTVTSWL